jgi:cytosine/adenosine deaminase-related metal-dependent hydrolase
VRTIIKATWTVAFQDGGHRLLKDGVVVVDDGRVSEVAQTYDGLRDVEVILDDHVLIPGLIDTHVHIGTRATHRLINDSGDDFFYGQPLMHWAITSPRTASPGGDGVPLGGEGDDLACRFTALELLRNGVTTFVEVGAREPLQRCMATVASEVGIRAYLGPGVTTHFYTGSESRRWDRVHDQRREAAQLDLAERFVSDFSAGSGLVRAAIVARELENCSPELLRHLADTAETADVPLVTHAGYSPIEWQIINQEYGVTPLEYLDANGALIPRLIIAHGNLLGDNHPFWSSRTDLSLLSASGASVSHAPINLVRRGRVLDSLDSYARAGVNLCLGADTFPRDPFMQMRAASYMCKGITKDYRSGSAAQVFEMATTGGADALDRPDLGRIAPGATADLVGVSLRPESSLRLGVVRDPVSALVDCAVGDDVRYVMVDGQVVLEHGRFVREDVARTLDAAQEDAERYWATVQDWHPRGETVDELSPLSFPLIPPS